MATGEAKQEFQPWFIPPKFDLISFHLWFELSSQNWHNSWGRCATYLRKKERIFLPKTKKQWLTRWRGPKAQPRQASVYFHQTSTLVLSNDNIFNRGTRKLYTASIPSFRENTLKRQQGVRTRGHPSSSSSSSCGLVLDDASVSFAYKTLSPSIGGNTVWASLTICSHCYLRFSELLQFLWKHKN